MRDSLRQAQSGIPLPRLRDRNDKRGRGARNDCEGRGKVKVWHGGGWGEQVCSAWADSPKMSFRVRQSVGRQTFRRRERNPALFPLLASCCRGAAGPFVAQVFPASSEDSRSESVALNFMLVSHPGLPANLPS